MNTIGMVRKIDDLGRIVLPKELRKILNINSGDDVQILVENEKIILEKYSRLEKYEESLIKIVNCFTNINNYKIYITINDRIINSEEIVTKIISNIILTRKEYINDKDELNIISNNIKDKGRIVILPIVIESDLLGSIIAIGNDNIQNIEKCVKIIYNLIKKDLFC